MRARVWCILTPQGDETGGNVTGNDKSPNAVGVEVTTPLERVWFQTTEGGRLRLTEVSPLPGGYLGASFAFRSHRQDANHRFTLPVLKVGWSISAKHGDEGTTIYSRDCACGDGQATTIIESFDAESGIGRASLTVPMIAVSCGTPLTAGANSVQVFVGIHGEMECAGEGPPSAWSHRFAPVEIVAVLPRLSVVVADSRLRPGDRTRAYVVLGESANGEMTIMLHAEFARSGCWSCSDPVNGLIYPHKVLIYPGQQIAEVTISLADKRWGLVDSAVRMVASLQDGTTAASNIFETSALVLMVAGQGES
jgi:hypothetical protein